MSRELTDKDIAAVCWGKVRFDTAGEVRRVIGRIRGKPGKKRWNCEPYRCPACHGWHQGRDMRAPRA